MALIRKDVLKKERHDLRLRAFPKFLIDHEKIGRGFLSMDDGCTYNINFDANFSDYCRKLDVNIWSLLERYISSSKKRVTVADIGCGQGKALHEVKNKYGSKVLVIGFELIPLITHAGLDRLVVGNFEENALSQDLEESIDLVVSDQVFRYFLEPFGKPYEKVVRMLTPGGTAMIDVFGCELLKSREEYDISANHRLTIKKPKLY